MEGAAHWLDRRENFLACLYKNSLLDWNCSGIGFVMEFTCHIAASKSIMNSITLGCLPSWLRSSRTAANTAT
jgi:hypothetical protein